MDIFERMLAGGIIPKDDPEIGKLWAVVDQTIRLSVDLINSTNIKTTREVLSTIIGKPIKENTTIFTPFHTNFGRHIQLGENVFINHGCSFLDLGGIIIEDDVLIGPQVKLITENHSVDPQKRKDLELKSIRIKKNAWIGAGATILPGVTIGENAVVAAGAVVTKDVAENTIVAGVPAKYLKNIL